MSGAICPLCRGDMEDIIGGDGIQCDTCGLIIRSEGSHDCSEVEVDD